MKKIIAFLLAISMFQSGTAIAMAKSEPELQSGNSALIDEVSSFLDSSPNTQTIVVSEQDIVEQLLEEESISHEQMNKELENLSNSSISQLKERGFDFDQIKLIKEYNGQENAYDYLYSSKSVKSSDVIFRYGLAGTGTRRKVTIAYDIEWTDNPFWTFTDSFAIGWIATDVNSYELVTKTDSALGTVRYYSTGEVNSGLYRNIEIDTSNNGVAIGNPIMGSANGNYGKVIGGKIEVSTQSNSSNMDTIHIFVAYAHTTIAPTLGIDVSFEFSKKPGVITFSPGFEIGQEVMVKHDHVFKYNSQSVIIG